MDYWEMVCEMIKVAVEGAREFGSGKVSVVWTFLAKATNIAILVAITRFSPSMISLGVRGFAVYFLMMSVSSVVTLVFTSIVSRIWVA